MEKKIGKHLEIVGPGKFRLLGDLPPETIDGHVHIGTYLNLPLLVGFNLTGPGGYRENLIYHLGQLWKHKKHISKEIPMHITKALEGIFDVGILKTDMRGNGPGKEPNYLLTSISSLFDPEKPSYIGLSGANAIQLLSDLLQAVLKFPPSLQQANAINLQNYIKTYKIKRAIVLPIETGRFSCFTNVALDVCKDYEEFIPFCSIHPNNPEARENLEQHLKKGALGLKYHPDFQGIAPDSEGAFFLFELCRTYNMTVQCHVGWSVKGVGLSQPERYKKAINDFPDVNFILCHMGLSAFEATLNLASLYPNIYLETSGQTAYGIRKAADKIGIDRIIFGTDWPLYHPAVPISRVMEAFDNDEDLEKVFGKNVKKLISKK